MIKIPTLNLPSGRGKVIFRKSNVSDALEFSGSNPDFEEKLATEYLNALIVEADDKNTLNWTAEDRMTALWFIYINTMPQSTIAYRYQCKHCGNEHIEDVDLTMLDDEITQLDELPTIKSNAKFNGRSIEFFIKPLNGRAMEDLELLSIGLDELEEQQAVKQRNIIQLTSYAHRISFTDEPEEFLKAFDLRVERIKSMSFDEYVRFVVILNNHVDDLRHGLHTNMFDGQLSLVSPPLACQVKESLSTRLNMRFRSGNFIPAL